MGMRQTLFICELPPPFGGVTVKNKLMLDHVFATCGVQVIDMMECKRKPWMIPAAAVRVAFGMLQSATVIIGVGSTKRRKILLRFQRAVLGRNGLKRIMLIVMGGQFHEQVAQDHELLLLLKDVGSIWVESQQMIAALQELGIKQTFLFPNCRTEECALPPRCDGSKEELKLVYFSRICIEKGMEVIMGALNFLDGNNCKITLDIYGEIEEDIREAFEDFVKQNDRVVYHGVYDAVNGDVYSELNQYDVMLLMSKREGVAGALVESKMAGITAIVSDRGLNPETVRNGEEGIVIADPLTENLINVINKLVHDRDLLGKLKHGAYESRKRYCIQTYRDQLISKALGQ